MTVNDLHPPAGDEATNRGGARPSRASLVLVALILAVSTLAVYWSATRNGFINFDDPDYVSANPQVQQGVTAASLKWAFTSYHSSNWHPLTWISHMVDWQLFGKKAAGHHLISILFHSANTVLLFLFLTSLTQHRGRAAFVAALFAFHPLHVESVAWISERKDLLCAFFFLLTLWTYSRYAGKGALSTRRRRLFYIASLICFALGLMSKPMVVTLPCVLLLLDLWPLRRLSFSKEPISQGSALDARPVSLTAALLEKVPFFALTAASSIATFMVQRASGATVSLSQVPIELRLGNAVLSYVRYLAKTFWPVDLAAFYPFTPIGSGAVAASLLLLAVVTAAAVVGWRRFPFLLTGWLWFIGMLVPVIGIVQVGKQAFADRYTYLPHIGLFIAITWLAMEWLARLRLPRGSSCVLAFCVLAPCVFLTCRQIPVWKSSTTLFEHAARVTKGNYVAYAVIATARVDEGKLDEAIDYCRKSLAIDPGYSEALNTLGGIYLRQDKLDDAISCFQKALQTDPNFTESRIGIGTVLIRQNRFAEAEPYLREALRLSPMNLSAQYNLALALHNQGKLDEAVSYYRDVISRDPSLFTPRRYLGNILVAQGKPAEAMASFEAALKIRPSDPETLLVLGMLLLEQGRVDEASAKLTESVRVGPTNSLAFYQLALVQQGTGKLALAVTSYREALKLRPDWPEALNNLAWILAANAEPSLRDGREAVRLAGRACELTTNDVPVFLGTLAAAYAEAGRFPEAITAAEKARDLASATGQKDIARRNEELLQLYRAGKPFHE